jgi:hypothetical protein
VATTLGALFAGMTVDVAEDEVRKKLLSVCRRHSATLILGQIYLAITRNQNEGDSCKSMARTIRV